jgi:hypothetical protein
MLLPHHPALLLLMHVNHLIHQHLHQQQQQNLLQHLQLHRPQLGR